MTVGLIFFILAAIVFGVNAFDIGSIESVWGFFCLALGHVFGGFGIPWNRNRQG